MALLLQIGFTDVLTHLYRIRKSLQVPAYEIDEKGRMTVHKLYPDPFMEMCNGEILSYRID